MRVFSKSTLTAYALENAQATEGLALWHANAKRGTWQTHAELKTKFANSADLIAEGMYVFNIKGNTYRLIARVNFVRQAIFVRGIFTHAEYDKLSRKQILEL